MVSLVTWLLRCTISRIFKSRSSKLAIAEFLLSFAGNAVFAHKARIFDEIRRGVVAILFSCLSRCGWSQELVEAETDSCLAGLQQYPNAAPLYRPFSRW